MPPLKRCWLPLVIVVVLSAASAATADDRFLLLFGGTEQRDFLGCLSCARNEPFSVWNPDSPYGSTTSPDSIWNRDGRYGAPTSRLSPWNPHAPTPPIVVDRAGYRYGKFTRNTALPDRVARSNTLAPDSSVILRDNLDLLNWILDNYDGFIDRLDEVRLEF